uniref:Sphingomyelin phosphodiesterase 4 n=1 Tax=Trichuris muris TaxID=70415 RepID=A0A5S6QLI3_TRIMR
MDDSFTSSNNLSWSRFETKFPDKPASNPRAVYFQTLFAPRDGPSPLPTGLRVAAPSLGVPRADFAKAQVLHSAPDALSDRHRMLRDDPHSRKSFGDFFTSALHELCANVRCSLVEAANVEQLADRFCAGLLQLFGKGSCLNLFTLNQEFNSEYDALYGLLRYNGVLLNCADQLLRGLDVKFEFTVESTSAELVNVKPSHWKVGSYEEPARTNNLHLTGFTSFEAYFFLFFWHVTKARIDFVNEECFSNAYSSLLDDYLQHLLSIRSLALALGPPVASGYRALFGGGQAFSKVNPVSPYGLLNVNFYSNAHESSGRPSAKVAYTELSWKATVFFNLLCDVWMCSPTGWRTVGFAAYKDFDICVVVLLVRYVLKRLYKVVYGVHPLSDAVEFSSDTGAFEAGALLRIFNFIHSLLQTWVSSSSFHYLLDLWLTAIQPWRCDEEQGESEHPEYTAKWAPFVVKHRVIYKHFFWLILKHFTYFKLTSPRCVKMLHSVCKVYSNPQLMQALKEHEMQTLMRASPSTLSGVDTAEEFFYGKQAQLTVRALLLHILRTEKYSELQLDRSRLSRDQRSWWQTIVNFFSIDMDNDDDEAKRMLVKLRFCRQTLIELFQMDPAGLESLLTSEQQYEEADCLPDSLLDQSGRLRLSPLGQQQVFSRFRQYPIGRYPLAPNDQLPLRSDEVEFLFRLQRMVSAWLNARFGRCFSRAYDARGPIGWMARRILESPSSVTMRNTPVLARHVDDLPARISLRWFASVRSIGYIAAIGCLLGCFGVHRFVDFYVILYSLVIALLTTALCNL